MVTVNRTRKMWSNNKPTAIDLFSGCGGLTLGLKRARVQSTWCPGHRPAVHRNVPSQPRDVTVWKVDIRDLEPAEIQATLALKAGDLDLLAGCPPCQGFSTLRTLNGALPVDDPRNDLLLDVLRFVDALRPKTVMIENVPGLADDKRFAVFCNQMREAGYCGDHDVLNAAAYGVPQRRRRLIYLAGLQMNIPFATRQHGYGQGRHRRPSQGR